MSSALVDQHLEAEHALAVERARARLLAFAAYTYAGFKVNWHHKIIARAVNYMAEGRTHRELLASWGLSGASLERHCQSPHAVTGLFGGMTDPAMLDRPIANLQVWLPPRHTKSLLANVCTSAFWLGRFPDARIITATYGHELSAEMAVETQKLMLSKAYREVFPSTRLGSTKEEGGGGLSKQTQKAFDVVGRRGKYRATSVGGVATGLASDLSIIDDPFKGREDAESAIKRERVWRFYASTLYTRSQKGARKIIANTRWHEDDLSGRLISMAQADGRAEQWFCIVLPALLDCEPAVGDPRRVDEALWPSEHSAEAHKRTRATIGPYEFDGVYQQRPSAPEGRIVHENWWRFYDTLPDDLTDYTLSADLTFEDQNDYCAIQMWAKRKADRYLVAQDMRRLDFTEQIKAFRAMCGRFPQCKVKLVEKAANGAALINVLKKEIQGIVAVKPLGSKVLRATSVAPQVEAGNVYLPNPIRAPWVKEFLHQWRAFPQGVHDDAVDAAQIALSRMAQGYMPTSKGRPLRLGGHTVNVPGL